ncbi:dTDP-4-dehydrorhamnose 3,5-epimerase [Woodsholea maritima]|uniref:dTDP-4-dehydrorhamnose 3,5-epimerase n=1 Tax=Woodsholea maritima TaxID=240237 RepID=UPI000372DA3B|nr:dTDP-4-dehydrorhamnose 3,5-epimerase [Woodsholea maritima]
MQVRDLALVGVKEITPQRFGDARGFFVETYNEERFRDAGLLTTWVQDNHSYSADPYVLRGLHFQSEPFAQDKLVRVLKGEIFDVAVDIRKGSPTYRQWVGLYLSADKGNQILVPKGFAHGFLTLTPHVEVAYKVSAPYAPDYDHNIRWDDPDLAINWPLEGHTPQLSGKDARAPFLKDQMAGFTYQDNGVR